MRKKTLAKAWSDAAPDDEAPAHGHSRVAKTPEAVSRRLQRMLDQSLERSEEYLSYTADEALMHPRAQLLVNAQTQTIRAVIVACVKLGVEAHKRVGLDEVSLERLQRLLKGKADPT